MGEQSPWTDLVSKFDSVIYQLGDFRQATSLLYCLPPSLPEKVLMTVLFHRAHKGWGQIMENMPRMQLQIKLLDVMAL